MTAGQAVLFTVVLLGLLGVVALVRRSQAARSTFDTLTTDDWSPSTENPAPTLTFVPDGFTCLRCGENPALPERVWCVVCAPVVDQYPAEPIERGGLR